MLPAISRRPAIGTVAILLAISGCSGDPSPTNPDAAPLTTRAPSTTAPPTTAAPSPTISSTPPSTAPPTATIDPTAALGYTFRQIAETSDAATVSIVYPVLLDLGDGAEAIINRSLDGWARQLADDFLAAAADSDAGANSILEVELAPEVRSRTVFSLSGLQFDFNADSDFSITRRIGWVFSIADGGAVTAGDLFTDGSLDPLAAAARDHLISDILGDPALLTNVEGVAPTSENYDAVWLTPGGVAVGFDQYQVAAADAGSPAVLIPYAELAEVLDLSGVLTALQGNSLPIGL